MSSSYGTVKVTSNLHCDRKLGAPRARGIEQNVDRAELLAMQSGGLDFRGMARKMGFKSERDKRGMKTSSGRK